MLSIRLSRGGAKKRPYYRIVVAEKASPRDGRFVELLGASNPMAAGDEAPLKLNAERYRYWLEKGALPTDRVKRLVRLHRRGQTILPPVKATPEPVAESSSPATSAVPAKSDSVDAAPAA